MIAALYVEDGGAYYGLPDVDPWPESRDARKYAGPWPVVAHPPCSSWCKLAPVNQGRYGHPIGNDGGCFASALAAVRAFGGVLEHPADSIAWYRFALPPARRGRWTYAAGGWATEVSQRAYGHRARKATWLYFVGTHVGDDPPELDWSDPEPEAWVSYLVNHGDTHLPRLSKREAKATPPAFRDLLLGMARSVRREAA